MSPKFEFGMPKMEPFDRSSDPDLDRKAHERFIEKFEATKARLAKAKDFERRVKNDKEFRSKIEARRALVRDLEHALAGLDLDIELRGPVQTALWKSVEDDEYARELFGVALYYTKSGRSKDASTDIMERVQSIPKDELACALVEAINSADKEGIARRSQEAA